MTFPIETIDNEAKLYYRIHKNYIDKRVHHLNERIKPWAFNPKPTPSSVELSTNWEKYIDANWAKQLAKKPEENWIVSFICWHIRSSWLDLKVTHQPLKHRSHSIIHEIQSEPNDLEERLFLRDICTWEIQI